MANREEYDFENQVRNFTFSIIRAAFNELGKEKENKEGQLFAALEPGDTDYAYNDFRKDIARKRKLEESEFLEGHRILRIGCGDLLSTTYKFIKNQQNYKRYEHQPLGCKGSIIRWLIPTEKSTNPELDQSRPKRIPTRTILQEIKLQRISSDSALTVAAISAVTIEKKSSLTDRFLQRSASLCVNAGRKVDLDDGRLRVVPLEANNKKQTQEQQIIHRSEIEEFFDWTDIEEPEKPTLPPFFGRLTEMPPLDPHATPSAESVSRPRKFFSRCANALRSLFICCRNKK